MSEANLWKAMDGKIGHLGHFSRVESHETSSGIPDVDYCIRGIENHVELKFGRNKRPKIRGTQTRWFRHRVGAGGHPYMFTHIACSRSADYWMLHQGDRVGVLAQGDLKIWVKEATKIWTREMDWVELWNQLQRRWNKK